MFNNSRKFLLLRLNNLKVECYSLMILLHFSFLLQSHNFLLWYSGIRLNFLFFLSTTVWRCYLSLGQFQNSIVLFSQFLKNTLRSLDIVIVCCWYGCIERLNIFFAVWIASVMIMMCQVCYIWTVWLILHLMVNNLTSIGIILTA